MKDPNHKHEDDHTRTAVKDGEQKNLTEERDDASSEAVPEPGHEKARETEG